MEASKLLRTRPAGTYHTPPGLSPTETMCHETWREDHPVDASHNYVKQRFIGARQRERGASVSTRHLHIWSAIIVEDTDVLRWMCHEDRLLSHDLSSPFGLEQTLFIRLMRSPWRIHESPLESISGGDGCRE